MINLPDLPSMINQSEIRRSFFMDLTEAFKLCLLILSSTLFQCTAEAERRPLNILSREEAVIPFQGRQVDLRTHLEAFPFSNLFISYDAGHIYFFTKNEKLTLSRLPISKRPDLWSGRPVSDIDFAGRNLWSMAYSKRDKCLYWLGDERNDEQINLWQFNPDDGNLRRLTDVPYIYSWSWNAAKDRIAYLARYQPAGGNHAALRLMDLPSGKTKTVVYDLPEWTFTFGAPSWHPSGKALIVTVLQNGNRARGNLQYIDLENGRTTLLLDTLKKRIFPSAYHQWLNHEEFIYFSDEDGYRNAYIYNLGKGESRRLTHLDKDLRTATLITLNGRRCLFAATGTPAENELLLIDIQNGNILNRRSAAFQLDIYDRKGNTLLVGRR